MVKIKKYRIWISIIILLIILTGILLYSQYFYIKKSQQKTISLINVTVLPIPYKVKPFNLVNQNNLPFTNDNLKGHWSVLFFGFTRCPSICPVTLSLLNNVYKIFEVKKIKNNFLKIIFITVDPDNDTPNILKKYLLSFNSHFIGVTGSKTEINKLTKQLGIAYIKAISSGKTGEEINHSGALIIINPEGKWEALITPPFTEKAVENDLIKIMK